MQLVIWHTAAGELTACHPLGLVLFWEPEEQSLEVKRAQRSRVDGKDTLHTHTHTLKELEHKQPQLLNNTHTWETVERYQPSAVVGKINIQRSIDLEVNRRTASSHTHTHTCFFLQFFDLCVCVCFIQHPFSQDTL